MDTLLILLQATLSMSLPLLLASMGGLLSERSGVVNISLEGHMLIGAAFAAIITHATHSSYIGLFSALIIGMMFGGIYSLSVITFRANQIVAGTAMNMLAQGTIPFVLKILYGVTGSSPQIPLSDRLTFAPFIFAFTIIGLIYFWLKKTSSGLWLSFAGEHPESLDASGRSVNKTRTIAVILGGGLAALGGGLLSIYLSSSYSSNMTAGRGFMSIAALILGKWKPLPTMFACLLFAFADALQMKLQGFVLMGIQLPVQFIQILPYLLTILVLAGFVGKSRVPKMLGTPFIKK